MTLLLPPFPGYQHTARCPPIATNRHSEAAPSRHQGGADHTFIAQIISTSLSHLLPTSDKPSYVNFPSGGNPRRCWTFEIWRRRPSQRPTESRRSHEIASQQWGDPDRFRPLFASRWGILNGRSPAKPPIRAHVPRRGGLEQLPGRR